MIAIPNINKPKSCYECPIAKSYFDCLMEKKYVCPIGHTDDCPLIEIPTPHGRLIDADEFKSWVDDWYDCTDIGNIVESWIDERPTILEAEE